MSSTLLHTTPTHSPSHSRSTSDYLSLHPSRRDLHFSPRRSGSATPSRHAVHESPMLMLTPSPLRRRLDVDHDSPMHFDPPDDPFPSTPFKPPPSSSSQPAPVTPDIPRAFSQNHNPLDDDDALFLDVGCTSLPMHTPARYSTPTSPAPPNILFPHATKRKVSLLSSTPHPKVSVTPIRIQHPSAENGESHRFPSLAPLPAPRFIRTPADAENTLKRQAESLRHLRIADKSINLDSSSEDEYEGKSNPKPLPILKTAEEVIESISPGGHIIKRRARSRPVSLDLLNSPSPSPPNMFPFAKGHGRNKSNGSSKSIASDLKVAQPAVRPEFDRIVSSATLFFGPSITMTSPNHSSRPTVISRSSGPKDPPATPSRPANASEDDHDPFNSNSANSSFTSAFAGPCDTSFTFSLNEGSPRSRTSSPRGYIPTKYKKPRDSGCVLSDDEDEDFLLPVLPGSKRSSVSYDRQPHARASTFPDASTSFSSSEGTLFDDSMVTPGFAPSASSAWPGARTLSKRESVDSFIVKTLTAGTRDTSAVGGKRMPNTPQKRTKTAFLGVGVGPGQRPWASAVTAKVSHMPLFGEKMSAPQFGGPVNSKARKSCPGNLRFPTVETPHASPGAMRDGISKSPGSSSESESSPSNTRAAASRGRTYGDVGLGRPSTTMKLSAQDGRAQLLMRRSSSGAHSIGSDVSSEGSSSGTPTRTKAHEWRIPAIPLKPQYTPSNNTLQFSPVSSNPSPFYNSPTGPRHAAHAQLPISGKKPLTTSTLHNARAVPTRRELGQFSTVTSQTNAKAKQTHRQHYDVRGVFWNHHVPSATDEDHEQPGRFEREFVEVDEIGAGEFGRAMKVRYKRGYGDEGEVLAIKKSKGFEGLRHRTRLREEVEVLKHLSGRAGGESHPNVLGYVDSWEQDETLYILTELCEYGNFGHFLEEYGRQFARLDEGRVWKVFADLSNGLRFIHTAGVIHLDLKPANIFITAFGRFKIGDFGMASVWPRSSDLNAADHTHPSFEREGDKMYLAAEVLQGHYGKETDIFSFGMTMLETAANIVVPTQGELWHKLREEDFGPVDGFEGECSAELVRLIKSMMRKDPGQRPSADMIWRHPVITRVWGKMEGALRGLRERGEVSTEELFKASPLAGVDEGFLDDILGGSGDWRRRKTRVKRGSFRGTHRTLTTLHLFPSPTSFTTHLLPIPLPHFLDDDDDDAAASDDDDDDDDDDNPPGSPTQPQGFSGNPYSSSPCHPTPPPGSIQDPAPTRFPPPPMLPDNSNHDPSFPYPQYYNRPQAIDVDALAAGVQRHMPPSQSYINLPGVDPATVDFRTFPYNPSEVKHRKRTTRPQQKVLEDTFKRETKPNASLRKSLAADLGMTPRGVQVWFQNRRAKEKALAKKARAGDKKLPPTDEPEDLDNELEDVDNSPATAASTIGSDSPSALDPPLVQSPEPFAEPRLPPLSTHEASSATPTNEDKVPKRESGRSPSGLGLSRTSWQSPPRTASELTRMPTGASPPPAEDDSSLSFRRGSLPTHIGSGNAYPPPPSNLRVRSCGNGVGGSIRPGGMVGFDPFARRLSLDRLASHPYAHLAVAANGAVFGPSRTSHPHRLAINRNHSPSQTPQPQRADLPSTFGSNGDQMRRPELTHRASLPPQGLVHGRGYDFPGASYRMRFPQEGHLYAISSRSYQPPVAGPLPEPDFSFGTSSSTPPSTDGENDPTNFTIPRDHDHDETEDGSVASYDAFSSRFGSIASVADSESSATSAYYSEVGSFEMRPSTSHSHQRCIFDQEGRRLSCASNGPFLDMFSNLDVDNASRSSLDMPHTDVQGSATNGDNDVQNGIATSPCGSPSSTVSGGSEHRPTANSLPISQSSELAFALQHVPERQDERKGTSELVNASTVHSTDLHSSAISFAHSNGSSSSGLAYAPSAASSRSSLGLPHLNIPDKFVFDGGIESVSTTGHYSPVGVSEGHTHVFDTFPPMPMDMQMHLAQHQYPRGGEDERIQLHDAMEYRVCPPAHQDTSHHVSVGSVGHYGFYN